MSEVYNVAVPVVDLITAASEAEAVATLEARLRVAGFEIYDAGPGVALVSIGAFVSED